MKEYRIDGVRAWICAEWIDRAQKVEEGAAGAEKCAGRVRGALEHVMNHGDPREKDFVNDRDRICSPATASSPSSAGVA